MPETVSWAACSQMVVVCAVLAPSGKMMIRLLVGGFTVVTTVTLSGSVRATPSGRVVTSIDTS